MMEKICMDRSELTSKLKQNAAISVRSDAGGELS
jgi:hypothetical protein